MPPLIRLRARRDFSLHGQTRTKDEIFAVLPIDAVRLRTSGVVDWAPPQAPLTAASGRPRRRYRRRDLQPES